MKKPWNLINVPIYSLATYQEGVVNMNICNYVSAVSMQPKKYMIAIDSASKTFENLLHNDLVVLQLLHENQFNLVKKLGNESGKNTDKHAYLHKKDGLETWEGFTVLKNPSARLLLRRETHIPSGDHTLFLFEILKYKVYDANCLTLDILREKKLVRI
ncbi:MAG: flavin reductase family protein [Spirosomaceae bacterium]|nr:flavin reductase family protein [Spirosomataceae bacterium]